MLLIIRKRATTEEVGRMAEDYDGYIKVVVDIQHDVLAGGGEMHVDAEQALLADGSKQSNLWGGGVDSETWEIDYNSMINLRPDDNNPGRDILSQDVRQTFDAVVKRLLLPSP